MKFSNEQQEQSAERIFDAMAAAARTGQAPKPWAPNGNSDMQELARNCARRILEALPGAPDGDLGGDPERAIPAAIDHSTFEDRLRRIINYHSMEIAGRGGDTPDFILAEYLLGALALYDKTVGERDRYNAPAPTAQATA